MTLKSSFTPFFLGKNRPKSRLLSHFRKGPVPAGQYRWDQTLRMVALIITLSFVGVVARLGYLQLVQGDWFYRRSIKNTTREIPIPAPRGEIRDVYGKPLAKNDPSYRLYVNPSRMKPETLERLRQYLHLEDDQFAQIEAKISSRTGQDRSKEILIYENLKHDQVALIESDRNHLAGVRIGIYPRRAYFRGPNDPRPEDEIPGKPKKQTEGRMVAHLLGYVNQVNPDEIGNGYQLDDIKGRVGIERAFEKELRGEKGFEIFTRDANGQRRTNPQITQSLGGESKKDPIPGNHVTLTIDMRLQRLVYQSIVDTDHATAAAVVDVHTGRILALVSRPAPDWNHRFTHEEIKELEENKFKPLKDRVLRESYFPASTFKLITALAAFKYRGQKGFRFDPYDRIKCKGEYWYKGQRFRCTGSHGQIGLHGALVRSCNVYFYKLAEELVSKVGFNALAETATSLGLAQPTHLKMGEASGFIPTEEYYQEHGGFMPGYTLNTAIGQGDVKVNVLQMAMAYAAFANGGNVYEPILVDHVETPDGKVLMKNEPKVRNQVKISKEAWTFITHALHDVVFRRTGTAHKTIKQEFEKIPVDLVGKTGTAQLGNERRNQPNKNNAWFVGFAPARDPKIAIAVFVEEGGHGGETAAPMAMRIAQKYFEQIDGKPASSSRRDGQSSQ